MLATEEEVQALRRRLSDIEKTVYNLSQRYYALESELRHRDQKEYLENKILKED